MKRKIIYLSVAGVIVAVMFTLLSFNKHKSGDYIILAWNNLGMHCSNKYFGNMAILPPYNVVLAQVIKKGTATSLPEIVTSNIKISYEIPGNTWSGNATDSLQKTDFWKYATHLFGANFKSNIGLTGVGMTGFLTQQPNDNFYTVVGIPLTPYTDADLVNEHPYQLGLFKLYDNNNNVLGQTQNVIPVSNEINCVSSGCHSSELDILNKHINDVGTENGFSLADAPILCAKCHADNALGTTGSGEAPPLSQAVHSLHGEHTNDCYKCHPGLVTKCLRDTMFSLGKVCQDCHGSVSQVGSSVSSGRRPWLDEPTCAQSGCHTSAYATESGKLYRDSKGHGGLMCSACHGSPHALVSTIQPNDNVQNISWQGYKGVLSRCIVCHGVYPQAPGPHGLMAKYVVEGNVNYDNTVNSPLSGADISLVNSGGTTLMTKKTNTEGHYQFIHVPKDQYNVNVKINTPWGGSTPTDAFMVNRSYIGLYKFTDNTKKLAGNVNADKSLNPTDALLINRRYIKVIDSFKSGDWLVPIITIDLTTDDINQLINVICFGDVDGSYVPSKK